MSNFVIRLVCTILFAGLLLVAMACGPNEQAILATVDAKISQTIAAIPPPTPQPTPTPIVLPSTPTPQPTATPLVLPPTPTPIVLPPTPTAIVVSPTPTPGPDASLVYGRVRASVARISTTVAMGSGFYIGDRWVVTAAHVVLGSSGRPTQARGIAVYLDSRRILASGTLIGWSRQKDVAVLRLAADPGVPALELRRTDFVGTGDKVYIVGYPLDIADAPLITEGIISEFINSTSSPPPVGWVLLCDIVSASGGSGSPILDTAGRVIGVNQIEFVDPGGTPTGLEIGITADEVLNILDALKAGSGG